jgi:DNA-binding transcriptional ArsR family regulator
MDSPPRELASWQVAPNEQQIKAVASATRLRILRLCNDREWTNKELAERLALDPSTVHRHVRLLVDAGLLESTGVRQGESGAYEKPYRSTGLSWKLGFADVLEDEDSGEVASLAAFRDELRESGNQSVAELTRFHLHLDEVELEEFIAAFKDLVNHYGDAEPAESQQPGYGGIFVIHRLADNRPSDETTSSPRP